MACIDNGSADCCMQTQKSFQRLSHVKITQSQIVPKMPKRDIFIMFKMTSLWRPGIVMYNVILQSFSWRMCCYSRFHDITKYKRLTWIIALDWFTKALFFKFLAVEIQVKIQFKSHPEGR